MQFRRGASNLRLRTPHASISESSCAFPNPRKSNCGNSPIEQMVQSTGIPDPDFPRHERRITEFRGIRQEKHGKLDGPVSRPMPSTHLCKDHASARSGNDSDDLGIYLGSNEFFAVVDHDHGAITKIADGLRGFFAGLHEIDCYG